MFRGSFLTLLISFLIVPAFANLQLAPPSINIDGGRGHKGVFVDFQEARYQITYDLERNKAVVKTIINFNADKAGYPILDLVPNAESVKLNGESTSLGNSSLDGNGQVRFVKKAIEQGQHKLELVNELSKNIRWSGSTLRSAFWMSDLGDRRYLEQYIPTNLEYDQYKMKIELRIIGTQSGHEVFTNGEVKELALNHWELDYPKYFTASSMFFHLTGKDDFPKIKTSYTSIDGREIPIVIYGNNNLSTYKSRTLQYLAELEKDYGPWPHPSLVIYGAGSGGMEYCGATITSLRALGHELIHSYFARGGIMPARGNAGWMDEAIASWRDSGYRQRNRNQLRRTSMAGHSIYRRTTDRNAYSRGADFMGYLDRSLADRGGLKKFLKDLKERRLFKPMLTIDFLQDLNLFFNADFNADFNTYIYGKNGVDEIKERENQHNIYHPILTEEQIRALL